MLWYEDSLEIALEDAGINPCEFVDDDIIDEDEDLDLVCWLEKQHDMAEGF